MRPESNWTRVLAAVLIGAGVVLLALRQFDWPFSGSLWPLAVIIPGLALFAAGATMDRGGSFLAATGAAIGVTGLILLGQELTDYYQSWAYLWTLLPLFAGLSLYVTGPRQGNARARRIGRGMATTGAVMFVVFTTAFEGLIFHPQAFGGGLVLPLVLILLGVALLFRMPGSRRPTGGPSGHKPA